MVYFRIDIGSKYGLGHYYRIKSIINFLKIKNYKIVIDQPLYGDFLKFEKKNLIYLNLLRKKITDEIDAKNFLKILKNNSKKEDIIIKDSYRFGYKWEKKVSPFVKKIIVIDDYLNNKHYADIYINHSPYLNDFNKTRLKQLKKNNKKNCKFLLGTKFALFNSQLERKKKVSSDIVFYNGGSGNIFIYEKIIEQLLRLKKFRIIMLAGPYSINNKKLEIKIKNSKNINLVKHPRNILNYLIGTKLFISSASIAMFESSFLKLPSLLFRMNKNQNLSDFELEKLGHFFSLDKKDIKNTSKITKLIFLMFQNIKEIKQLMFKENLNLDTIKKNYIKEFNFYEK